ncbi:hypothetical protein HanRHA438_Chr09g0374711 [Helianthus annuus]|uniref:Uncharacterized protein n=1 Tax=Helianthus annuus TaxID=4232 RepID=A0A9K3N6K9_HELAN|nr:hypothetical protein HanXRQr2_Chr09g0363201 [Helianthus annuus]KAJ0532019.1 hypothetical protein HanIR_Chr09g0392081 [Helianthus annuus]KAJ0711675.1 hypothetical protein HanOQP8_Chr09g0326461 [Helianthus annuus]KAJ0886035.1 hypothetical protein HanRHA438_Chr09g0374711 [Helianthus annuus]
MLFWTFFTDRLQAALGVNYECRFTGYLRLFSDIIKLQKSLTNFDHAVRKRDCNEGPRDYS